LFLKKAAKRNLPNFPKFLCKIMTESKNQNQEQNFSKKSDPETTGHNWDGISEYNIAAPRWWLIVWIICIIWAFIYWIFYPTWPISGGNSKGILQWSQKSELARVQQEITIKKTMFLDKISRLSLEQIQQDPKLMEFALNGGASAFKENCAACHGTGAQGSKGFPNLNDDDWLWGGKIEDIYQTIQFGIRSSHDKTRFSQMPSFGLDKILTKDEIKNVAQYVISLSDKSVTNQEGEIIFKNNCAVCHGKEGRGDQAIGAPNLSDAIWLYGGKKEDIIYSITYSRAGVMPYWTGRLDDNTIKELTLYVYSLGGGQ
jgi:cytochrome c oxidase cbb3-type subunit 3